MFLAAIACLSCALRFSHMCWGSSEHVQLETTSGTAECGNMCFVVIVQTFIWVSTRPSVCQCLSSDDKFVLVVTGGVGM